MSTEQLFEELAKKYPDLMQKSVQQSLGVGPGWYYLLDTLCGLICNQISHIRKMIAYHQEHQEFDKVAEYEAKLPEAIADLPVIHQIKEKFGGMRFYIDHGTEDIYAYIQFAESMSYHVCEECGAPGEPRNTGWVKVRCDRHQRAFEKESFSPVGKKKPSTVKLSDEHGGTE